MADNWQIMAGNYPPIGTKFVALHNDGGGATLLLRGDEQLMLDANWEVVNEEALDDYLMWCEVPSNYRFWGESK